MSFRLPGLLPFLVLLAVVGCAPPTSFQGNAQFPDGPKGCWTRCKEQGMDMSTFVYVGDYSSACACKPRIAAGATSSMDDTSEGAVIAAAAGVEMQRRQAEDAARNRNRPIPGTPGY